MKKRIRIDGMSCDNCVRHVTVALKDLDGVSEVDVRLDKKQAIIVAEKSRIRILSMPLKR